MSTTTPTIHRPDRAREDKLRRMAYRQLLQLKKSRARTGPTVGTYWLISPYYNTVEYGDTINGYGVTLDQIEAYLAENATKA